MSLPLACLTLAGQVRINTFPLYYEITYKEAEARAPGAEARPGRSKFFLCFYCGKEFTTKSVSLTLHRLVLFLFSCSGFVF